MVVVSRFKHIIANAYNYKAALQRENIDQAHVDLLREKVRSSECVPKFITNKQLLIFLKAGKKDIEKSTKLLHNHYKIKKSAPKLFGNRNVESKEIQDCLNNLHYVRLPVTPNNEYLMFHRLSNHDPKDYNFDSAAKTFIMLVETDIYFNGPRDGIVFLFDMTGVGLRHLLKPSIDSMRKGIRFLNEGLPTEIKAIHVLNPGFIFEKVLAIVRPLAGNELLKKVVCHPIKMDYEKFYKKYIPKTHLPLDYGGDLESVEVLHNKERETFRKLHEYFLLEEMQTNFKFDEFADEYL